MMLVRRCEMLPVECIVRGYLAGSAWKEYRDAGTVHGVRLPAGLREADPLPEPIFTPVDQGGERHPRREHLLRRRSSRCVGGRAWPRQARALSLAVYRRAAAHAEARGIIVADTKLELGLLDGRLVLADEVLTPGLVAVLARRRLASPARTPPSYDKQPVRDWLEATGWDKRPPPPPLPRRGRAATRARYVEVYERLSGRSFADWPGRAPA